MLSYLSRLKAARKYKTRQRQDIDYADIIKQSVRHGRGKAAGTYYISPRINPLIHRPPNGPDGTVMGPMGHLSGCYTQHVMPFFTTNTFHALFAHLAQNNTSSVTDFLIGSPYVRCWQFQLLSMLWT